MRILLLQSEMMSNRFQHLDGNNPGVKHLLTKTEDMRIIGNDDGDDGHLSVDGEMKGALFER